MGKPHLVTTDTSARSPERERLAAAVDRHRAAAELLSRIKTAHELAEETGFAVRETLAAAEAKLAEATANADKYLAAVALGEADGSLSPVKLATADVERAKNDLSVARATIAALETQQTVTATEIEAARYALDDAIKLTMRSETTAAVAAMLAQAQQLQADLINARVRLRYLLHRDGLAEPLAGQVSSFLRDYFLPATLGCISHTNFDVHPAANQWRDVLAELRIDADAPLPT